MRTLTKAPRLLEPAVEDTARTPPAPVASTDREEDFWPPHALLAHELRTPLHTLGLQLEGLRRVAATAPSGVRSDWLLERLDRMNRSIARLRQLSETFLSATAIARGELEPVLELVDARELTRDVLGRLAGELRWAGCELSADLPAPQQGEWDRLHLDLVLTNLLTNAMKHGAGAPVHVRLYPEGDAVALMVRDHGPGVAPADRERIFRRSTRADDGERASGFGLGLWLSRRLLGLVGGTLTLDARVAPGAAFVVRLPRTPPPRR